MNQGISLRESRPLPAASLTAAAWTSFSPTRARVSQRLSSTPRRTRQAALTVATAAPTKEQANPTEASQPSSSFDWKNQWYPVVLSQDVGPKTLYPFTLLNVPIVIWRDPSGAPSALRDACPHRLVPLSEGRIAENGSLECAYHGWQFSGCGACTAIPQGGDPANPRAAVAAFQCVERQGMVWVKLQPVKQASSGNAADAAAVSMDDIPVLPELDEPDWFEGAPVFRDLPMEYSTLIENVVDAGHVPFTHHGSVSRRQTSGLFDDMKVLEEGKWGFRGTWPTGPRKGGLGAQNTLFQGPNLMRHTIDAFSTRGFANITAVYGVPTTPGHCRVIVRQPFRFKSSLPRLAFSLLPQFFAHLGALSVFDDDNIFLHIQEREAAKHGLGTKPVGQVYYMPGASDAYVIAFRRWIQNVAGGGPFGPQNDAWLAQAGPRLPNSVLLDHYHSHVEKCASCSAALRRMKALSKAASVLAFLGAVAAVAAAAVLLAARFADGGSGAVALAGPMASSLQKILFGGGALAGVAGAVRAFCAATLPKFFKGEHPPPRNLVPGEWLPNKPQI